MKKRILAAGLAAAALAGTVALASPASASGTGIDGVGGPGVDTIAEAVAGRSGGLSDLDSNPFDYDILLQAVQANPLTFGAATNKDAALTVFAPNDLAFRQLTADLTGNWLWLFRSEQAIVGELVRIFGLNGGVSTGSLLETVLTYHVVGGKVLSSAVLGFSGPTPVTTLLGADITVTVRNTSLPLVVLGDVDTDDLDAVLAQTRLDIPAGQSVVHGITQVLRPADVGRLVEFRGPNLTVAT